MTTIRLQTNQNRLIAAFRHAFTQASMLGELLQNARRAKARHIHITTEDDTLTVSDDGEGIANLQALICIAESGWDEELKARENPFGIGVLSTLYFARSLRVHSLDKAFRAATDAISTTASAINAWRLLYSVCTMLRGVRDTSTARRAASLGPSRRHVRGRAPDRDLEIAVTSYSVFALAEGSDVADDPRLLRVDVADEHGELVAAEAGAHVGGAQEFLDAAGDLDEEFVAEVVAAGVVDVLEAVEVEEDHRGGGVVGVGQRVVGVLEEERAVAELGQRVHTGEVQRLVGQADGRVVRGHAVRVDRHHAHAHGDVGLRG